MKTPSTLRIIAAFASIYVIWGSTYIAIRLAIESMPPLLMAGVRFLLAGLVMYGVAWWQGAPRPRRVEWKTALVVGGLLLLAGNGGVCLAEQYIPSSTAALLVATMPMWMALWAWRLKLSARPTVWTWSGLILGFVGVGLLLRRPAGAVAAPHGTAWGFVLVLLAAMAWAYGSVYSKKNQGAASPIQAVAMQMLCGAALLLICGVAAGELGRFQPHAVTFKSVMAFLYLVTIGSLVGFTSYIWLLRVVSPAKVATYAYVNPVIAVLLGWGLGGETITVSSLLGAAIIIGGVAIIVTSQSIQPKTISDTKKPVPA